MSTRMTWNSSEMPLPPCMSRAARAISSALPQLLRLSGELGILGPDPSIEHDLAGNRGAQAELAPDLRSRKTGGLPLDDEAADRAFELRPHASDIGDRRIGVPHLGASEPKAARRALGARCPRAGIGAVVRP